MDILISASFIASFFAGIAALFAPCCITVLLPTYFGSIFKEKVTVLLMTFIYLLGMLVVFLPLGLGATFLSRLFSQYHNLIFLSGGIFLIFLGITMLLGKQFSLPFSVHPKLKNYDVGSILILGIFSAIATTCCAPVLAGVLALSALPGSYLLGMAYTLTYVLGMVMPLFIIATFLDKYNFTQKFVAFRKTLVYIVFGQKVRLTFANLFSGITFLILGIIIFISAQTNQLLSHASYQLTINIYLAKIVQFVSRFTQFIPEYIWGLFFMAIFIYIILLVIHQISQFSKHKGIKEDL